MRYARAVFCLYLFYRETLVRHAVVEQYRQHAVALHANFIHLQLSSLKTEKYRILPENVSSYLIAVNLFLQLLTHLRFVLLTYLVGDESLEALGYLSQLTTFLQCKFELFFHNSHL